MTDQDPLLSHLRAQARAYNPDLPPGAHRRILESIATTPTAPPRRPALRYVLATTALAATSLTLFLVRPHPITSTPPHPITPSQFAHTTPTPPHPVTLAQQLVDDPLEREYRAILSDLTRAANTLTHVLPAPKPNAG